MTRHVLYAYVDGSNLEAVAPALEARFLTFVANRRWVAGKAWAVNQRQSASGTDRPGDLPAWDLGLNLELPDPGEATPGWFADIEEIARFLGRLQAEYGRDFTIGIADASTGIAEDLFSVTTPSPNMMSLRSTIGIGDAD